MKYTFLYVMKNEYWKETAFNLILNSLNMSAQLNGICLTLLWFVMMMILYPTSCTAKIVQEL